MWMPFHLRSPALDASSGGDPYWASTGLLIINDNKGNGTTAFADQSSSAKTITAVGTAQYDTSSAPTGMTSSGLFTASTDYLTTPANADFNFGTGDFTVEFFYKCPASIPAFGVFFDTGTQAVACQFNSPGTTLIFVINTVIKLTSAAHGMVAGSWYHLAFVRGSGNLYIFVNGVQKGTIADSTAVNASGTVNIGRYSLGGFGITSNMGPLRVTKGVARYTAGFTPPTLPLPTS